MIPVYMHGLLSLIYSKPSASAASFTGAVALWSGLDWIHGYILGSVVSTNLNWVIAIIFISFGTLSLLIGIFKGQKLYWLFGRRSILTFFAITFYPMQVGYLILDTNIISVIAITAIPSIIILEIFGILLRKIFIKNTPSIATS